MNFYSNKIPLVCSKTIEIPVFDNIADEAIFIARHVLSKNDIIVIDCYNFDTNYEQILKENSFKLVCIDDLFNRHFVADIIINHGGGITNKKYSVEHYTRLYLGTKYSILRQSFFYNSAQSFKQLDMKSAFINLGGTDIYNYTLKALKQCLKIKDITQIDIVIGSCYKFTNELNSCITKYPNVKINVHKNISEEKMCELMQHFSVGICSASTVSYEYATVGGVLFLYKTADNQKNNYSYFLKNNLAFRISNLSKICANFRIINNYTKYLEHRSLFFSGNSQQNIVSIFENLEKERNLKARLAQENDLTTYFNWVNEQQVRENSINQNLITLESHSTWFLARLNSDKTLLYFFEKNNIPLGQVRFDIVNNCAEIDYSIDVKFRKQGYGEVMLTTAIWSLKTIFPKVKFLAQVKQSNVALNKVFEKIFFKKTSEVSINKEKYNNYEFKFSK